tara:strand:- start:19 stop:321 length:303 start_codon:yes stop_codon:yes gene_type:complete
MTSNYKNWEWARDVKNQYAFHLKFNQATHQITFDKKLFNRGWIRKRKIMKIINDGTVSVTYSVFNSDYLIAIYSIKKKININEIKKLFGEDVYDKILSFS